MPPENQQNQSTNPEPQTQQPDTNSGTPPTSAPQPTQAPSQPALPQKNNKMPIIITVAVIIIVAIVAIVLFAMQQNKDNQNQSGQTNQQSSDNRLGNTYTDNDKGFSINFPKDWEKIDLPELRQIIAVAYRNPQADGDKELHANLTVATQDIPEGKTEKQYIEESFSALEQQEGYELLENKTVTINDRETTKVHYKVPSVTEGTVNEIKQIVIIKDNKSYIVTATTTPETESKYKDLFEAVFNSFKIK